jgi:hypothetical protein
VKWLLVDSSAPLEAMVDTLRPRPSARPRIFIPLENIYWSGEDRLGFLAIHHTASSQTFIIDVYTLGATAFSKAASDGMTTLKTILESLIIPKCMFGVRNDSATLYYGLGVRVRCIYEVQLVEVASRQPMSPGSWRFQSEFDAVAIRYSKMAMEEMKDWIAVKPTRVRLVAEESEKGEIYEVFRQQLKN